MNIPIKLEGTDFVLSSVEFIETITLRRKGIIGPRSERNDRFVQIVINGAKVIDLEESEDASYRPGDYVAFYMRPGYPDHAVTRHIQGQLTERSGHWYLNNTSGEAVFALRVKGVDLGIKEHVVHVDCPPTWGSSWVTEYRLKSETIYTNDIVPDGWFLPDSQMFMTEDAFLLHYEKLP